MRSLREINVRHPQHYYPDDIINIKYFALVAYK